MTRNMQCASSWWRTEPQQGGGAGSKSQCLVQVATRTWSNLRKMSSTVTETVQVQGHGSEQFKGPAKLKKDPTIAKIFESLEYGPAPEAASSAQAWLEEHERSFGHFINGKWVKPDGRKVYETRSPATGVCCSVVPVSRLFVYITFAAIDAAKGHVTYHP